MRDYSTACLTRRELMQAARGAVASAAFLAGALESGSADGAGATPLFRKSRARVALVFAGDSAGCSERERLVELILTRACPRVEFRIRRARTAADLQAAAASLDECDGAIAWMLDGRAEPAETLAAARTPLVVVSIRHEDPTVRNALLSGGIAGNRRVLPASSRDWKDILQAAWSFPVLRAMKETTILAIAEQPPGPEDRLARMVFGTRVARISGEEVHAIFRSIGAREGEELAASWMRGAQRVEGPPADALTRSARLHLALCRAMAEHRADVVAVDCAALRRASREMPFCCLSHLQMNDEGAVAVCRGDVNLACAQALLRHTAGRPGFLCTGLLRSDGGALLKHSACMSRPNGPERESVPYRLRPLPSGDGVYVRSLLPAGDGVTLVALDLGARRLDCGCATTCGNVDLSEGCRTGLAVKPRGTLPEKTAHAVAVLGDWSPRLQRTARLAGLRSAAA